LKGEANANRGQQKGLVYLCVTDSALILLVLNDFFPDSIDVQAVQAESESQVEALNTAISLLEVCVNIREWVYKYIRHPNTRDGVHHEQRLQTGRWL
jgi:hypothetical protein